MKYVCARKFTEVYVGQNYPNSSSFDEAVAKIKLHFSSLGRIYTI